MATDDTDQVLVFINRNCHALNQCPYSAPYSINYGSHCVRHITKLNNQALDPSCDGSKFDFESTTLCAVADLLVPCPRNQCVDHNKGNLKIQLTDYVLNSISPML